MKIPSDKEKFSERLKFALRNSQPTLTKTSDIALRFNLRHLNEPVTQQAVHKWLNGLAIPSQDKIDTLADWLSVKPEWLRYGVADDEPNYSPLDEMLIELIYKLSEQQKTALLSFITAFKDKS
ncbi:MULTISPECIES: transcriptional regulator [unclassified Mannheimia]|uniref:transcriptional regulator n=1 Tax=unclassified Mannheimia TaxID=2645054 RepID=UPI00359D27D3